MIAAVRCDHRGVDCGRCGCEGFVLRPCVLKREFALRAGRPVRRSCGRTGIFAVPASFVFYGLAFWWSTLTNDSTLDWAWRSCRCRTVSGLPMRSHPLVMQCFEYIVLSTLFNIIHILRRFVNGIILSSAGLYEVDITAIACVGIIVVAFCRNFRRSIRAGLLESS